MAKKKRAQLVFIPLPFAGHFGSAIELAKLLSNRHDGISVTVLVINSPFDHHTKTTSCTDSLSSFERINVIHLPPSQIIPSPAPHKTPGSFMADLLETQKPHVIQAVSNLTSSDSAPPLAAFVVDMFCTTMIDVAQQFGVPSLVFFTSGVAFLGLMLHLHTIREKDHVLFDYTGSEELAIPCFANPVPANTLPSFVANKERDSFFMRCGRGLKRANGFIVNSFEELESHALRSFSSGAESDHLPVYPVGPILNPNHGDDDDNEEEIIKWLDQQPPSSVLFLCFGSKGPLDEDQVKEIAIALENSGARFLWSLRKPQPKGMVDALSNYTPSELPAVLPHRFLDRTAGIGKVIGWAPQAKILAHPATGGFVSHCGWNSTLESIYHGVPIAAWPLHSEQQINAFQLVCEMKMAVEIALDYRVDITVGRPNMLLSADQIERGIRSVLDKDGEVRKKVKEMSEKSRKTLLPGGCSYSYLGRLVDYILDQV